MALDANGLRVLLYEIASEYTHEAVALAEAIMMELETPNTTLFICDGVIKDIQEVDLENSNSEFWSYMVYTDPEYSDEDEEDWEEYIEETEDTVYYTEDFYDEEAYQ